MSFQGRQESDAGRSPDPGRGRYGQGITEERMRNGAEHGDGRFEDRDLQQAAGLALLAWLAGCAMVGRTFHVLAAIHAHAIHHRHAHGLHRAGFCRCLHARHPAEGKRQANHEDDAKPQIAFHGLECRRCKWPLQLDAGHKRPAERPKSGDNTGAGL